MARETLKYARNEKSESKKSRKPKRSKSTQTKKVCANCGYDVFIEEKRESRSKSVKKSGGGSTSSRSISESGSASLANLDRRSKSKRSKSKRRNKSKRSESKRRSKSKLIKSASCEENSQSSVCLEPDSHSDCLDRRASSKPVDKFSRRSRKSNRSVSKVRSKLMTLPPFSRVKQQTLEKPTQSSSEISESGSRSGRQSGRARSKKSNKSSRQLRKSNRGAFKTRSKSKAVSPFGNVSRRALNKSTQSSLDRSESGSRSIGVSGSKSRGKSSRPTRKSSRSQSKSRSVSKSQSKALPPFGQARNSDCQDLNCSPVPSKACNKSEYLGPFGQAKSVYCDIPSRGKSKSLAPKSNVKAEESSAKAKSQKRLTSWQFVKLQTPRNGTTQSRSGQNRKPSCSSVDGSCDSKREQGRSINWKPVKSVEKEKARKQPAPSESELD